MADSFVFYASFAEAASELDNEQYGALMRAINDYALFDKAADLQGVPNMLFTLIKPQLDANKKRRENAKKGGAPSGNNNAQKQPPDIPHEEKKQPSVDFPETKKQPNVNGNGNGNENENENENGNVTIPPEQSGGGDNNTLSQTAGLPEEAKRLATLLYTLHKRLDTDFSKSDRHIQNWAEDIAKINRLDNRSWADIEAVIRWVKTAGNFWASNIMSGSKLREKFPQVFLQMQKARASPLPIAQTDKEFDVDAMAALFNGR